jgi:hypothetical protein
MSYLYGSATPKTKSDAKGKEPKATKSSIPKKLEPLNTEINLIPTEKGSHPICHGPKCACNQ